MSLFRDPVEAWLSDLHAEGSELVQRYEGLLEDASPSTALAEALRALVDARTECLAALGDRLRAHDALPRAGDPDRAFLQALGDALGGDAANLLDRLGSAEAQWRRSLDAALDDAVEQDWAEADVALLERLAEHMDESQARLAAVG